ncbi:helix-turn-helix domain-containing protein, partial [Streptomyces sp. MB09-01]|uniref:helix-turn-helix domain-containing protein n=1 Tax=Streptomyces sp. MB09-01 TaxID=3028666 RepID=UPI0029BF7599
MPSQEELFDAVDALLEGEPRLPSPAERARLREAAGVTQARLAAALKSTPQTVKNWENGRSEPRPPRLQAYLRLLDGWAERYPALAASESTPESVPAPAAVPKSFTGPVAKPAAPAAPATAAAPDPVVKAPVEAAGPSATSRRPVKKAAPLPAADPRFPHGPLVVLDGDGSAYGVDGIVLDCPATT